MTKEKIVKEKIVKDKPLKEKSVKEKLVKEKPVKEKSVKDKHVNDNLVNDNLVNDNLVNDNLAVEPVVKQKRGRKSKKELQLAIDQKLVQESQSQSKDTNICEDNITCSIQEISEATNDDTTQKPGAKKRGRKPKGGKIIQQITNSNINTNSKPNIILHLKCSLKDLQTNTLLSSNVESYNFSACKGDLSYDVINSSDASLIKNSYMDVSNEKLNNNSNNSNNNSSNNNSSNNNCISNKKSYDDENSYPYDDDDDSSCNKDLETKEIWRKLKQLEHNLHINNISDKKSACFWCTYEFDNPPVYIPKHFIKNSYQVYGCFCSPECSTAYLMEENIDSSIKFERYHLINHIYSQIYDYKKNIKPAPNPYYMLDKYYGNLNIQEYRSLLRNDRLFLIVDKPLTRILPELHEDNDDFIINNKIIPSNTYQIKKKLQRKTQTQNKNNIFNEKFNS